MADHEPQGSPSPCSSSCRLLNSYYSLVERDSFQHSVPARPMRPDPSSRLANERNHPRFNIRSQSGKHKKRWEFPEKTKYAGLINRNPLMKQRSSDKRSLPGSILASLSSVSEKLTSLAGALVPILILATSEKPQTTTTLPLPSHGSYLLLLSHSMKYSALALNPDWA